MTKFNLSTTKLLKVIFSSILILILQNQSFGQISDPPDPCDDGSQPTCQCITAPILCTIDDLDGFEYSMSTFQHPQNGPNPLCIGVPSVPNNPTWFAFIAWCTELTLNVEISNCTNVCSGTNGQPCQFPCSLFGCTQGIQIAIYGDCDFTEQVGCNVNDCGNLNDKLLNLQGLEIGKVYYFMVDGCAGSSCDVRINVVGQCGNAEIEPWTNPLMGPDSVCVGTSGFFTADNLSAATLYHWYVDGNEVGVSTNPEFQIDFPFEGTFQICVDASNEPCIPVEDPPAQNCTTVEVYFPIDFLGEFIVCQENLPFQLGGNFFTQPGLNEFIVTDPNGCEILNQFELEVIINEPFDVDTVLCKEDFPFFFAKTSETITGPGTVFVPATDAFGCDSSYFVNFYQIDFFVQFEVPDDTIRCPNQIIVIGASSTAVYVDDGSNTPVDQVNFQWLFNGDVLPGQTGPTIEAGAAGEFTLIITGVLGNLICSDTTTIELFENYSLPPAPILNIPPEVCLGNEFEVSVENQGLLDGIVWTVSSNGFIIGESESTIIVAASDTGTIEICARFFRLDCPELTTDSCFSVPVIGNFSLEFEGLTGFCSAESTIITLDSNLVSFFWNGEEGDYFFEIFESDTLNILAFDSLGCRGELILFIEEFSSPEPAIFGSPVFCEAGSATLSVSDEFILAVWNGMDTSYVFSTNEPGLVSVFVTDNNNCRGENSVELIIAEELDLSIIGNTEICFGESTTLSTDPVFPNYLWSNGQTTAEISVNESGMFSVIIDDGQGCFGYDTIEVVVNSLPDGIINQSALGICPGENINLSFDTSDDIQLLEWSTGDSLFQINISSGGTYLVTAIDINGCIDSFSINVIDFPEPVVLISGNPEFCSGQNTMLSVSDNFISYNWSTNENASEIIVSIAGLYTVTVTDINGCEAADTTIVVELQLPEPEIIGEAGICEGEETLLVLNEDFVNYNWSGGQTTNQILVNESGTYSVTVTGFNGCINSAEFNLVVNELPEIVFTGSRTFCTGFTTTISIQDFPEIIWSNGETGSSIIISEEGIYTVMVTDANGCQAESSISITEDDELQPVISGNSGFCPGDATLLDVGTGFNTYIWNTGQTGPTILVDLPGTYSVTVTDADGCSGNTSIEIEEYTAPNPVISGDELVCFGESAVLFLNEDYETYLWSTGATGINLTVNETGFYAVTVTDSNNCQGSASFSFEVKEEIIVDILGMFEICEGETADWMADNGFSSYIWSNGSITQEIALTESGIYSVTVTDEDGCSGETSAELTVNPLPVADAGPDQEINCLSSSVLIGEGINTEPGFGYFWNNTQTGEILEDIIQEIFSPGTYELVIINNATSCFASDFVTVTLDTNDIRSLELTAINPRCFNENSGSIRIDDIVGGTSPFVYTLNNFSSDSPVFGSLTEGEFSIRVTDANGCFIDTTIILSYPPEVIVELGSDIELTFGESVLILGDVSIGFDRIENIVWTINGQDLCNPCDDIQILYDLPNSGVVELVVEDFNGCSDMDRINVFVRINRNVYIPNAFSPNSDGINDFFTVFGTEIIDVVEEIMIFNRWGSKVFERRNIPPNSEVFGWDGTFNGEKLNPAVFGYYIRVRFIDGVTEEFTGDVLLTN